MVLIGMVGGMFVDRVAVRIKGVLIMRQLIYGDYVQRSTKEEHTASVLLDLIRLSVWLHSIIISTCQNQNYSKEEGHPPLPSAEAGQNRK